MAAIKQNAPYVDFVEISGKAGAAPEVLPHTHSKVIEQRRARFNKLSGAATAVIGIAAVLGVVAAYDDGKAQNLTGCSKTSNPNEYICQTRGSVLTDPTFRIVFADRVGRTNGNAVVIDRRIVPLKPEIHTGYLASIGARPL